MPDRYWKDSYSKQRPVAVLISLLSSSSLWNKLFPGRWYSLTHKLNFHDFLWFSRFTHRSLVNLIFQTAKNSQWTQTQNILMYYKEEFMAWSQGTMTKIEPWTKKWYSAISAGLGYLTHCRLPLVVPLPDIFAISWCAQGPSLKIIWKSIKS